MFSADYRNCLKTWKALTSSAHEGEVLPHWALLEHSSSRTLRTRGSLTVNSEDSSSRSILDDDDGDDAREPKAERMGLGKKPEVWTMPDEDFWRENLEPIEYRVLRGKNIKDKDGGSPSSKENNNKESEWASQAASLYGDFFPDVGYFGCRGCGLPLFSVQSKFQDAKAQQQQQSSWGFGFGNAATTGPPTFGCCIAQHVQANLVQNHGKASSQKRAETSCARCACHLGHCRVEANPTRHDPKLYFREIHVVHGLAVSYVKHSLPPAVFQDRGTVLAPRVLLSAENRPLELYQ